MSEEFPQNKFTNERVRSIWEHTWGSVIRSTTETLGAVSCPCYQERLRQFGGDSERFGNNAPHRRSLENVLMQVLDFLLRGVSVQMNLGTDP